MGRDTLASYINEKDLELEGANNEIQPFMSLPHFRHRG
jgi:hypothetical protein